MRLSQREKEPKNLVAQTKCPDGLSFNENSCDSSLVFLENLHRHSLMDILIVITSFLVFHSI